MTIEEVNAIYDFEMYMEWRPHRMFIELNQE